MRRPQLCGLVLFSILLVSLLAMGHAPSRGEDPAEFKQKLPPNTASATEKSARLPRSTPEQQGVSSAALLKFIEAADRMEAMHSFMLVRHGQVVAEGWWGPYDAQTPHVLYSLSKSFAATAVGFAIAEGKLSVDDEVLKFFPEDAPKEPSANLKAMRVRDLLRMNTGHQTEPPLWFGTADPKASEQTLTKRFLEHPVPHKPGTRFVYNTPATYMLSAIVQKVTGKTVLEYLGPKLYQPLGFEKVQWLASPQGVTLGGFGMLARTEEIAKFGQLYLQQGKWNGEQLLPADWVKAATSFQTANGSSPQSDWDQGYGYQFWRSRHNSYRGDGAFGQYCIVLPEQDAVIAITGGLGNMQAVMNQVFSQLLPAMKADALPEYAEEVVAAQKKLKERLAGLAMKFPAGKPSSPLAEKISGKWYEFPENDRGIKAVSLEADAGKLSLVVRTAAGETRTPIGLEAWPKSAAGFTAGMERNLGMPEKLTVSAAGAWAADHTLAVKLVAAETPFYTNLSLHFDGDRLNLHSQQNIGFGPQAPSWLIGHVAGSKSAAKEPARTESASTGDIRLLVRIDDMGVSQSVNEACIKTYREGIARSVEVIVPGPWFLDAVRLLKENPGLDVGVHLTLTSEWERVKWRPLTRAPSLVDEDGYFQPMTRQRPDFPANTGFVHDKLNLDEVERELRAQIETARRHLGKRVTHVSAHMGAAGATPQLKAITQALAKEYGLLLEDAGGLKSAGGFGNSKSVGNQRELALVELLEKLPPGDWRILEHPGLDTPEMRSIGHKGYENVAADRAGVTQALVSPKVKEMIARRKIKLISFADLVAEKTGP